MNCKFLSNGLALSYDHLVKPCCIFGRKDWEHTIENTDLTTWFDSAIVKDMQLELDSGKFPERCFKCKNVEEQNRGDSMRLNGERSYDHYTKDDITLEIRPGNTCNFACQTCWPTASSRVSSYHKQAFGSNDIVSKRYTDYRFLDPIAHRLRNIVLLGGEPFYDKNCSKFLEWLEDKKIDAELTLFTNGSMIDWDFVNNYKGKLTIVVSLDAMGKVAEYIRPGAEWETVRSNYKKLLATPHINTRVNITVSVYSIPFIGELLKWLARDWPEIVSFGTASETHLDLNVVPKTLVDPIVKDLRETIDIINNSNIVVHQKQNTQGVLQATINRLLTEKFNSDHHKQFVNYMTKLDMVKNLYGEDYDSYFKKIKSFMLTR
jgi:hypothetical protein